jgi:hypothetical protein
MKYSHNCPILLGWRWVLESSGNISFWVYFLRKVVIANFYRHDMDYKAD